MQRKFDSYIPTIALTCLLALFGLRSSAQTHSFREGVTVSISPVSATLPSGGVQQFTATVSGSRNEEISWSATGGSVSSEGLYTAPATAGTYTVTATSQADTMKSASATVTVTATPVVAVSISPGSASLLTGGTQQFTATITGTSNAAVTWSTTGGTVSTDGLYTAPATTGTYTVTATSQADTTKSASAAVTVTATPVVAVSISPGSASLLTGGTRQFTATITGTSNTAVTWSTTGGTVSTDGLYTAPATAGTYTVTATSEADTTKSASAVVTVTVPSAQPVAFVQVAAATPQSPQSTVTVVYPAAQTAGDLNVVVVGWNDSTSNVTSVSDSSGNAYILAVGPTTGTELSQSIYYAKNIVSGSNTVTVTFNQAAASPDIRILEYAGLDTSNPLDVTAASAGNGNSASSGSATTTAANELILGADTITTTTTGPGNGFTTRIISSPDSDLVEDEIVSTNGSDSATASLSSGSWVMQMATFKGTGTAAAGQLTVTPTALSLGSVVVGTSGTASGSLTASDANVTVTAAASSNNAVFTVGGLSLPTTIPAAQSASFSVTFSPQTTGVATATLTFTSNAQTSMTTATVTGTGTAAPTYSVSLSWAASPSPDISGYNIYRAVYTTACGSFSKINSTLNMSTLYTDSVVMDGTSYCYASTTVNSSNEESGYSNIVSNVQIPDP